ncbi:hypothetical protein B0T10DRAFT_81252 [Thelonectria olida]|uniref:Uncharacterized protein n=1 Tax=Thelonectria olida TaxID=1576542 RepID=A0A9P8W1H6_9HYPO|nr:hypothetical protein B0T10DRAFT_81252 [Thelonectria olida]
MAAPQKPQKALPFAKCLLKANSADPHHTEHALLSAAYSTETDDLAAPRLDNVGRASIDAEINRELDVKRLARIQRWWWLVGLPKPPRPLHKQVALGRNVVIDEKMDMHLVWTTGRIYLKPIPRFILCDKFWSENLTCQHPTPCPCSAPTPASASPNTTLNTRGTLLLNQPGQSQKQECSRQSNRRRALGFLLSYVALVRHESDFIIAQESRLIPKDISWPVWNNMARSILSMDNIYHQIDPRFVYGELRLSRLNKIYRCLGIDISAGYVSSFQRYDDFWRQNFTILTSSIAYMVIVLTAMQVGLATEALSDSHAFDRASYGFTVFCILGPLIFGAIMFLQFCFMFANNWVSTKRYVQKRRKAIDPNA